MKKINNNLFLMIDNEWKNPDPKDYYWGMGSIEETYNTAICLNQNGFKKFLNLLDYGKGYELSNVQNKNACWSKERYPSKYPCVVQYYSHFEGSMYATNIKYKYEVYVTEIENYYGHITLMIKNGKYFYGIENDSNTVKKYIEIEKTLFCELLNRADCKSKEYHTGKNK